MERVQTNNKGEVVITVSKETAMALVYNLQIVGDRDADTRELSDDIAVAFGGWDVYNKWVEAYDEKYHSI